MKSLKMFTICEICPADHLKAEKGYMGSLHAICNFVFSFLYLKFGLMNFFCLLTDTRKGTHMFSSPAILGNLPKETR